MMMYLVGILLTDAVLDFVSRFKTPEDMTFNWMSSQSKSSDMFAIPAHAIHFHVDLSN